MNGQRQQPDWVLWITDHGVRVLILFAIAFMAFVYAKSRSTTQERLDAIEASVGQKPPRAYTPPNLDDYSVGDVDVATLPVAEVDYVPVYSHIYHDGGRPYSLEITLSIRNVDPKAPVYIDKVDYYDTDGNLSRSKLDRPIMLRPLQTIEFLIERTDAAGGSGANFIVEWRAARRTVHRPLIEAVMVGRSGTNAISFVRKAEPLPDWDITD